MCKREQNKLSTHPQCVLGYDARLRVRSQMRAYKTASRNDRHKVRDRYYRCALMLRMHAHGGMSAKKGQRISA